MTRPTLDVAGVSIAFDGIQALAEVSLELAAGEILGLIGPNGAGKSTLVNVISGFVVPDAGAISVDGHAITGADPADIVKRGVARSFQGVRPYASLTVLENLEVSAVATGLGRREARARAVTLLGEFGLGRRQAAQAGSLPAGEQRRLAVLRALATQPRFALLDEPAAGLNDAESEELVAFVRRIREDFGCGVMLIEHDMRVIMPLCDRIHVLNYGRTIASAEPAAIRADPAVIAAYLGGAAPADADPLELR